MIPRELSTVRLLLRQWRDEDAEPLHEIYAQPEYLQTMPPVDLESARAQVERWQQAWEEDGYCQWAACELRSGRLIGRIGILCHHDWPLSDRPVPEVGWVLHRDFWGQGLATEGGQASVAVWREHLPDEARLLSITTPANRRSRAVMNRCGLRLRGTARWHGYDVVWYSLERNERGVVERHAIPPECSPGREQPLA
jgi:ribosomal-protein-alanine N-acetyltransferase